MQYVYGLISLTNRRVIYYSYFADFLGVVAAFLINPKNSCLVISLGCSFCFFCIPSSLLPAIHITNQGGDLLLQGKPLLHERRLLLFIGLLRTTSVYPVVGNVSEILHVEVI